MKHFIYPLSPYLILFLTFFLTNKVCLAQPAEDAINMKDFFSHQKNYIPGSAINQAIKTINVGFNIWQRDDGSGNFVESEELFKGLQFVVDMMNYLCSQSREPSHPIEGIEYLKDSHIRFELKSIDFYQNTELYNATCISGTKLNDFIFQRNPSSQRNMNFHFTGGNCRGAAGYANYPSASNMSVSSFVVSFVKDEGNDPVNYPYWAYMLHLLHEIGHNLELHHPYDSEFCSFNHPDFLFDLFGDKKQEFCTNLRSNCDVCYHQGKWDCDLTDPNTTCTNNIMGGNKSMGSITPLQMGRMNRSLAMRSVRQYAWGYSPVPYVVEKNEIWDIDIKFYQDIVVKSGHTLHLKNTLEMVPEASIIVEPGAKLIVDKALITNAMYSDGFWQGIKLKSAPSRGLAFWRPRLSPGQIEIINGGIIENSME
jgi:hypothetical protein